MEYVSHIVEVRYWRPYRLSSLKMSCPPFGLPTQKKLALPLIDMISLFTLLRLTSDWHRNWPFVCRRGP